MVAAWGSTEEGLNEEDAGVCTLNGTLTSSKGRRIGRRTAILATMVCAKSEVV